MFKIIKLNQKEEWNEVVSQFDDNDIYLDRDYYRSLAKYQDSEIRLLYYENNRTRVCEIIQINDIANDGHFTNLIRKGELFDIETPYGYGGLTVKNINDEDLKNYYAEKKKWANNEKIVSEFIRFNPLLSNYKYADDESKILNVKSTVFIELKPEEELILELNSKNRNMVRKAIKNNINIEIVEPLINTEEKERFIELYKQTMERNNASAFYFFNEEYFDDFFNDMKGKCKLFCAKYNGKTIASAIMIFNNKNMHYFLSGADREFMSLAPNNLLLFKAGVWGYSKGFHKFHLGGGVSDNDALFSFKKQFNEKGILPFYIGRTIFDSEKFNYLVELRKKEDGFDINKPFLIKYRQE